MYINLTLAIPSKMYVNEFPPVNSARIRQGAKIKLSIQFCSVHGTYIRW